MVYTIKVMKDGLPIADRELDADAIIAILAGTSHSDPPEPTAPRACKKCGRSGKHASTCPRAVIVRESKALVDEIEQFHAAKGRKSKVSDEDKARVEASFIEGMSVGACYGKFGDELGVSDAWFYTVRARLKKDGRLPA